MKTKIFEINEPGLQTTIQDLGRYGFQNIGVPVSGPMDMFSFKIANMTGFESSSSLISKILSVTIFI